MPQCPFNESYTLPVSKKPIYENAPTGRVEECNACLLDNDCTGGDTPPGCYQPCFGYEPIDDNLPIKYDSGSKNYTADPKIINKKWEPGSWKYIMFLKDPNKGTITNVDGQPQIAPENSNAKLTDPLPPR